MAFLGEETSRVEPAAKRLTTALKQGRLRLKEDAFSMLVHDLRSPIFMVLQHLDLSVQGRYGALTTKQHQVLSDLRDNCAILLGFIDDVLDVYRCETGRLLLEKTVVDVPKLIHQSARLLQHTATDKGVCLETHCSQNVPSLVADEKRITRVLVNLLDNAIRFSPRGESVILNCCGLPSAEALITVIDAGPGIAREHRHRVFERFYQVQAMQTQGAVELGLGLAFCRLTVHAHGGKIWVESPVDDRGRGSRFCFTLPANTDLWQPAGSNGGKDQRG